jgi:hypothetical protein
MAEYCVDLVAQLRRKINEPTENKYTTTVLFNDYIYPNVIYSGEDGSAYDLDAAAAVIWADKVSLQQNTEYAINMVKYFSSKRVPRTSEWEKDPEEDDTEFDEVDYIINE